MILSNNKKVFNFCARLIALYVLFFAALTLADDHDHDHDNHDGEEEAADASKVSSTTWGEAVGAAICVNLVALTGVMFLIPFVKTATQRVKDLTTIGLPSFAVGALLSTTAFIIIPESSLVISGHYIEERGETGERDASYVIGASLLAGFFLPTFFGFITHKQHDVEVIASNVNNNSSGKSSLEGDAPFAMTEEGNGGGGVETAAVTGSTAACETGSCEDALEEPEVVTTPAVNYKLCSSILVGDAFHNLADGIFIGTAFKSCKSIAIGVTLATVYHELAQELADFFLLTRQGGLSPIVALACNFISGLSVLLGVIIILSLDMTDLATSVIIIIAGGVYLHVAAVEAMPIVEANKKTLSQHFISLFSALLGIIPIALVLLDHEHCSAGHAHGSEESVAGGHDGHDHRLMF